MEQDGQMAFSIDNNFAYTIALSQNEGQLYSLTKIDVLGDEAVDRIDENSVERLKYDISDYGVDWNREIFEATYHEDASGTSIPLLAESKEWNITFSILILRDTRGNEYWGLLAIPLTAKTGVPSFQKLIDGSTAIYAEASIETIDKGGKELNAVLLSGLEMQSDPQIVAEKILDSNYQTDAQMSWAREQRAYADAPSEKGHLFKEIEDENLKERIVDEVSQIQVVFNHVRELYRDM